MLLIKNKINKEKKQMSNEVKNEDTSKKRFLLHLNKISSDVRFVISEEGKDFSLALETFFRWVNERKYENDTEDKMRTIRMKHMTEENEKCKAEIASLTKKKATKYDKKLRGYEEEKKCLTENLEKIYRKSDLNRIRTEVKNKNDLSIYSENIQDSCLKELEEKMKKKLKSIVDLHENNIIETEIVKKNLLKKGMLLDMINKRYSHDMLMRYNKNESLQQTIKSKINLVETLKVNVMSIEMNLKQLEEDEKMYFKREFFDKLDAIKEKIALRAISKFLLPYVNLKFKSRRLKILKKKKTKNHKKL